jgi:hypothetical protein
MPRGLPLQQCAGERHALFAGTVEDDAGAPVARLAHLVGGGDGELLLAAVFGRDLRRGQAAGDQQALHRFRPLLREGLRAGGEPLVSA